MTLVRMASAGSRFCITAQGHTDPRVCAGISCLMCTAAAYIDAAEDIQIVRISLYPADAVLEWNGSRNAKFVYDFLKTGLLSMRDSYEENIVVKII